MATRPWIMREGSVLTVTADPDGTPTPIPNMCEYVRGIALNGSPTTSNADTMCEPVTLQGNPTWDCLVALVWSPEMYAALQPYEGQECEWYYQADGNMTVAQGWTWRGVFTFVPFGNSALGEAIIEEMPVSVLAKPTFAAPAP